jgi:hypothetical protein
MYARLNRSFEFLLPKADEVPEWILTTGDVFYAFLAGYIDAEGYIKVSLPRGYKTPQVRLEIRATDGNLLRTIATRLHHDGIRVVAGYVNKYGVRSTKDLWGLAVCRTDSLLARFARTDRYMRHGRRRRDMLTAWSLLRGKQETQSRAPRPRRLPVRAPLLDRPPPVAASQWRPQRLPGLD